MKTVSGHAAIVLSLMYLVFFGIDRVNNAMCFIDNDITKFLLVGLALLSIANAALLIQGERRRVRRKQQMKKRKGAAK